MIPSVPTLTTLRVMNTRKVGKLRRLGSEMRAKTGKATHSCSMVSASVATSTYRRTFCGSSSSCRSRLSSRSIVTHPSTGSTISECMSHPPRANLLATLGSQVLPVRGCRSIGSTKTLLPSISAAKGAPRSTTCSLLGSSWTGLSREVPSMPRMTAT